jgi:D-xylose transport system substrate-binding protein
MRRVKHTPITRALAVVGALLLVSLGVTACGDSDNGGGGGGDKAQKVGVLLPDTKSSVRWGSFDRPLLKKAFDDAGVPVTIQNAQGDKSTQQQQAEQLITNGAKVLLLVNLDSGSGAAIENNAKSRGVKVIDYDRLTLKGSAQYYVSFDNVQVGKRQGQGLVDCLNAKNVKNASIAELNGSPTPSRRPA